jgi:hypothetical protein
MTTLKKQTVNYKRFSDKIIEMIFGINNLRYDHLSFQKESNKLGKEIYSIGGYHALFTVMNLVEQEILDCEYSNEYLGLLREIEWSFNGICEEWQA